MLLFTPLIPVPIAGSVLGGLLGCFGGAFVVEHHHPQTTRKPTPEWQEAKAEVESWQEAVATLVTERDDYGGMVMPDVITLYRFPLCAFVRDEAQLVEEVTVTVVHEVAHHFGIDDDKLHEWGWG